MTSNIRAAFNFTVNALRTAKEAVVEEYRTNFVAKPAVARVLSSTTQLFKQGVQDLVESNLLETTGLVNTRDTVEVLKDLSVVLEGPSALQKAGQAIVATSGSLKSGLQAVGRVLAEQPEKIKKINQLALQELQAGMASVGRGITTVAFAGINAVDAGIKAVSKVPSALRATLPDTSLVKTLGKRVKDAQDRYEEVRANTSLLQAVVPETTFVLTKEKHLEHTKELYKQAKAYTHSLIETPGRSGTQIQEAIGAQGTLLNQLGDQKARLTEALSTFDGEHYLKAAGSVKEAAKTEAVFLNYLKDESKHLSEARTALAKDALKFVGKAVLVAGAVVITGLAVRSLYRYFTATPVAVKQEEAEVVTRPRANAVLESAASSTSVRVTPTPTSSPRSSVASSGSMPYVRAVSILAHKNSSETDKVAARAAINEYYHLKA